MSEDSRETRLLAALTPLEMAGFIRSAHEALGADDFARVLAGLMADSRRVLLQVLAPATETSDDPATAVSVEKQRAQWGIYHKAWNKLMSKALTENSAYWIQENHWEPPYFDTSAFLDDLLEVLQKMAPLRETAIVHRFKGLPDFPSDLGEIYAAIEAGTPDWSYFEESLDLNRAFTTEVMAWSWASARFQGQTPAGFLEAFYPVDLELRDRYIELNTAGFVDFFVSLEPEARQQILACLEQHHQDWADELDALGSPWCTLYLALLRQQRPEAFLATQTDLIEQDWQQGAEVVRLWCERGDPDKAWELVQMTFAELIRQKRLGSDWAAETSLLASSKELDTADRNAALDLLELAQQLAGQLGLTELDPVLQIQRQALEQDTGWEPMLKLFRGLPLVPANRQALFADWKSLMVLKTFWLNQPSDGWVSWLLDAALTPDHQPELSGRVSRWLESVEGSGLSQPLLLLLTQDLLAIHRREKAYPKLSQQLGRHLQLGMNQQDRADRRRYLKQLLDPSILEQLLEIWRRYAHLCVPDPARASGSDYEAHAAWLKALQELGSDQLEPLLDNWRNIHHRRRNLWKALAAVGIS